MDPTSRSAKCSRCFKNNKACIPLDARCRRAYADLLLAQANVPATEKYNDNERHRAWQGHHTITITATTTKTTKTTTITMMTVMRDISLTVFGAVEAERRAAEKHNFTALKMQKLSLEVKKLRLEIAKLGQSEHTVYSVCLPGDLTFDIDRAGGGTAANATTATITNTISVTLPPRPGPGGIGREAVDVVTPRMLTA
ncbi:uncharacterized protein MAM_07349 [Metarhizium album ARSEF 1941]|uniref:Uncharacterized protein n=1 Tax=Metarhizium album (strain ARSEF 1941) TaxID=1081103 RepID=A0A0B2WLG6_METAS|nr:uncharacterized protein MAM_07349 [Metarhizium album ARSEF 1941]KHN94753.1 hypothetical protein MAM_07349 [Metarhizium album ARSEF 1941]